MKDGFPEAWLPLSEGFRWIRDRLLANDGGKWALESFSQRKYINARIDMRTGSVYLTPGNEPKRAVPDEEVRT